jgi:biopolymer transport protein ExbB
MFKRIVLVFSFTALFISHSTMAEPSPLQKLLDDVEKISQSDLNKNRLREAKFMADLNKQQALLEQSRLRLKAAELRQSELKTEFDNNDIELSQLEALLRQRSGQLGEVFGVAKEVALDLAPMLQDSMTSAEHKNRGDILAFAESKRVPELKDLQNLWYQQQLEMTLLGEVKQFESDIINSEGLPESANVLRIGPFTAVTADGRFLNWDSELQQLVVLSTQPSAAYQRDVVRYLNGEGEDLLIDPSRGQLLMLLDRMPKLLERLQQGGEVGYLIMGLGLIGLLVAVWQMSRLTLTELRVRQQLKHPESYSSNNPLGRILKAMSNSNLGLEQLEIKVDEVTLKEVPKIERGQSIIKLLAAVAPLLGLLGTVVGMIATFQSITLFGTSDPKLMAGGISQALMTTVLGLVVAIPLLFCHSYLAAKSRRMTQILQEKSLGLLVKQSADTKEKLNHAA